MSLPKNYKKFPNNVQKPTKVELKDDIYNIYGFKFKGLQDFYDFLKQNPDINYQVWRYEEDIASINGKYDFAGVPYDEALEKLVQEMDPGYQEYISIQKNIHGKYGRTHQYKNIKTVAGGVIDPVSYTTSSPTIYRTSRLVNRPKFITIDTQIAYYWGTNKKQVFNRALIITNLINALEKNGYNVDVNSFMIAENHDEIIKAIFEIKKHGQKTNYQTLYKSLVDVEFFRRLCFRVMEISDVQNRWCSGYGKTCNEKTVRELLKLKKEDIYFDQPDSMGIYGKDIGNLDLQDIINVKKEKEVLKQSVKVLRK